MVVLKQNPSARKLYAALIALLLGGCMSAPVSNVAERPSATAADAAAEVRPVQEAPAEAQIEEASVEAVLAERRRSDYPEIATDEAGFTITEQLRIGGDDYSRYEQALIFLRQERYQEGIRLLEAITEDAPALTAPWVELGIAYRRIGELEHAAEALEFAAALSPEHPIVHNELGIVYRKSGRFAEARAEYETALAVFSDFHFARRNLAVLCDLYLADLECALTNYRTYLETAGEDAEVEIWAADLANRMGVQQ